MNFKFYAFHFFKKIVKGSVPPLASIGGSLMAGPCLTILGRKKTLMLIAPIYSAGFLFIGFATETWMLIFGRVVSGLMIGISTPSAQIFVKFNFIELF